MTVKPFDLGFEVQISLYLEMKHFILSQRNGSTERARGFSREPNSSTQPGVSSAGGNLLLSVEPRAASAQHSLGPHLTLLEMHL